MTARDFLALLADLPDAASVPVGWIRERLAGEAPATAGKGEDELLDAAEAARRLGVTTDWLYRRTKTLPFAKKLSRKVVRYSAAGLARYLTERNRVA